MIWKIKKILHLVIENIQHTFIRKHSDRIF